MWLKIAERRLNCFDVLNFTGEFLDFIMLTRASEHQALTSGVLNQDVQGIRLLNGESLKLGDTVKLRCTALDKVCHLVNA